MGVAASSNAMGGRRPRNGGEGNMPVVGHTVQGKLPVYRAELCLKQQLQIKRDRQLMTNVGTNQDTDHQVLIGLLALQISSP